MVPAKGDRVLDAQNVMSTPVLIKLAWTTPWAKVHGSRDSLGLVVATDHWVEDRSDSAPFEKPSAAAFSMLAEIRALS